MSGGFARFVLGSAAERLLERLHGDVPALKAGGFAEALARHLKLA